jgi:hypothetical protein
VVDLNEFRILKIRKYRRMMHRINIRNLDKINNPKKYCSCSGDSYIKEIEDEFQKYEELNYDYKYYRDLHMKATEIMELECARRQEERKQNLYRRVDELEKEIQDIKKRLD